MRFIFLSTRNPLFPSLFFRRDAIRQASPYQDVSCGICRSRTSLRVRAFWQAHYHCAVREPESPGLHTPYPALRVCRCQHAEVGNDGGIIMVPAVALRRYVHNETDMEVRFVFQHGNGIFSNLVVQPFGRIPVAHYGGVMLAQSYALSASPHLV